MTNTTRIRRHPNGLDMPTVCGHAIRDHHKVPWGFGSRYFCSMECMAATDYTDPATWVALPATA